MSRSIHFISKSMPGCGPPDGRRLPCSGVPGRALGVSTHSSRGDCKLFSDVKFISLRSAPRYRPTVCNASSSNYKRNPDFARQNKHGFSRHRNRHSEAREEYEDLEESETLSSKNGPVFSVSGNQKFLQATATPGPREKEIVELFRKVQAQLRERAAKKEERKIEGSRGKSKESETVDSLLKLLRKHSVQQGKKSSITAQNKDFILDQDDQVGSSTEERGTRISDSTSSTKPEMQESSRPHLSRPKSSFRKRSPVPQSKFQPVNPEDSVSSISEDNSDSQRKWISLEPEADDTQDIEYDSDSDVEPLILEGNDFDEISDDDISESGETEHDDMAREQNLVEARDLHGVKLAELKALAKSRGMKGFSKMKKNELIELLSGSI